MIFDLESVQVATVAATFAIATLAALISWSQRWAAPSRTTLAVFFAVFALSELDTTVAALTVDMPQFVRDGTDCISFTAKFFIMPLFLIFVRELIVPPGHSVDTVRMRWHFALPGLALAFACFAMILPSTTREAWYSGEQMTQAFPGLAILRTAINVLTILLVLQWSLYVIWVARTQAQHIARLRQHFASTEGLEVRWVALLAFALGFYVARSMVGEFLILAGAQDPIGPLLDSLLVFIMVVALALWGLRPSPELENATRAVEESAQAEGQKYEKSALGPDQSERIARKLLHAMQADRLYRDPNLTLSTLAGHIGVSVNYASQTLNQRLDQSFFEFVNSWRVQEAIPLVEAGEETVLAIAYEVGFNSRSSFYSAFKRQTGLTPTAFKATKSAADQPTTVNAETRVHGTKG